jgi:serine/threonine-protein kinase RsbW
MSKLKTKKYSQDDIFAVHLAVEEAFLNAIKHGNQNDPKKGIKIDCSVDEQKVEISVTDNGDGFDPNDVPDPRIGENLYKLQGRGLFLIRSYMHKVDFNERGNRIRMIRYKNRDEPVGFESQKQV